MLTVKICGIRRLADAQAALAHGADLLGFVFYPPSPRSLGLATARALVADIRATVSRTNWAAVGVFVNEDPTQVEAIADACRLDYVQLHGNETPNYCRRMSRPVIKGLRLASPRDGAIGAERYRGSRLLLDAHVDGSWGGTGTPFDWEAARPYASDALVAGGLTPNNVADALAVLRPWGVDVSSGVERDGHKDPALIESFLKNARAAAP